MNTEADLFAAYLSGAGVARSFGLLAVVAAVVVALAWFGRLVPVASDG